MTLHAPNSRRRVEVFVLIRLLGIESRKPQLKCNRHAAEFRVPHFKGLDSPFIHLQNAAGQAALIQLQQENSAHCFIQNKIHRLRSVSMHQKVA